MAMRLIVGAAMAMASTAIPPNGRSWQECPGVIQIEAPAPAELAACVASSGALATESLRLALGEEKADIRAVSSLQLDFSGGLFFTDAPVNLSWTAAGREFVFENVGGTGQSVLMLNLSPEDSRLDRIEFAWQNRPLNLAEAISRAKQLQVWLGNAGFRQGAAADGPWNAPFGIITDDDHPPSAWADGWDALNDLLGSDGQNIAKIYLFTMMSEDTEVRVSLRNMRREALNFQDKGHIEPLPGARRTIFDGDGGYEWLLTVSLQRSGHDSP